MLPVVLPDLAVPLAPLTTLRLGGPARRLVDAGSRGRGGRRPCARPRAGAGDRAAGRTWSSPTRGGRAPSCGSPRAGGGSSGARTGRCCSPSRRGRTGTTSSRPPSPTASAGWSASPASRAARGGAGAERRRVRGGDRRRAGRRRPPTTGARRCAASRPPSWAWPTARACSRAAPTRSCCGCGSRCPATAAARPIRYAELARALGVAPGERVPAAVAREAVLALRRGKGMVLDPADHDTWSAGSFFTNPVLADGPAGRADAGPPGEGRVKVSAAWLIERAGFRRGHPGPGGRVALSEPPRAGAHPPRRRHARPTCWRWRPRCATACGPGSG